MDLLSGYASDGSDNGSDSIAESQQKLPATASTIMKMNLAPSISLQSLASNALALTSSSSSSSSSDPSAASLNAKYSSQNPLLNAPLQGPAPSSASSKTFKQPTSTAGSLAGAAGVYHPTAFDAAAFNANYNEYISRGTCDTGSGRVDVSAGGGGRSKIGLERHLPITRPAVMDGNSSSSASDARQPPPKRRKGKNKYDDESVLGSDDDADGLSDGSVWAPAGAAERNLKEDSASDDKRGELQLFQLERRAERADVAAKKGKAAAASEGGAKDECADDRMVERKLAHLLPPRLAADAEPSGASTKFHGKEERDYQGRKWTDSPAGVRAGDAIGPDGNCYVPTKVLHKYTGHTKGVHAVRLFPKTGHLILSAGLDGKVKIWTVYGDRKCMRTYSGHTAAVRDVCFNEDGSKFLSCSFDRYIRLWDTFSGECLKTFTNRRVPYCVKFYPLDDNFFVVGCSDNKAVTYDATTGEITQEYAHHLAPVNTVTFCEGGKKLVTTSDDKKVLVWEWDIGVPIKYIAEPEMQSMPSITLHPSGNFFLGQSLGNEISVYSVGDKFSMQRKKFKGHQVAGFACEIAVSPNGRLVASGDGGGKLYFWEWNTGMGKGRMDAHDNGPTISCAWHPIEPAMVITCGWDGVIKLWGGDMDS